MSGAEGGIVDGVLTVVGAVIGWVGRARRHHRRGRSGRLEKRIDANERAIRRLWRDVGRLEADLTRLAVSLWEARRQGRRWHDPPR